MLNSITNETSKEERREIKTNSKKESREYSKLKKSRWALLMNRDNCILAEIPAHIKGKMNGEYQILGYGVPEY